MKTISLYYILTLTALLGLTNNSMAEKLKTGQPFPSIQTTDVWGRPLNSEFNNGKTWWLFERFIGCPMCNLRMHNIATLADSLTKAGNRVIVVLESEPANITKYVGEKPGSLIFVSDPKRSLYQKIGAEVSMGKAMKGLFHGFMAKANAAKKVMGPEKRPMDGSKGGMPAEIVTQANGTIVYAHYARYLGDFPEISDIRKTFNQ